NSIGLPFNSGTIIAFAVVVSLFILGLKISREKQKQLVNTLILSIMFIFIGFSCWLMLPIRTNSQIPINENKPSDAAELLAYYNHEQYGSRSLFYDTYFTIKYGGALDPSQSYKDSKVDYERDYQTGKYIVLNDGKNAVQNYSSRFKGFLPRMWEPEMAANYMTFSRPIDFNIKPEFASDPEVMQWVGQLKAQAQSGRMSMREYDHYLRQLSDYIDVEKPTFFDNMGFMFNYQFGYMYTRYLMWNFAGRQNDIQGYNDR